MEENNDMRNMLLSELIDKMHSRLADKMFPPDPSATDTPAVEGIDMESHTEDGHVIPSEYPPAATEDEDGEVSKAGDTKRDSTGIPDEDMSEEELEDMLKGLDK